MARVPNTISFAFLELEDDDHPAADMPLHLMPDQEVDAFIKRCAAALRSHGSDFHTGHDKENARAAFESTLALLLEFRDVYPERRADIDTILAANGYPVLEN